MTTSRSRKPIGTPEELREAGIPLSQEGSCAPMGDGVQGCDGYERCIFVNSVNGNFKGKGPRYVGYHLRTTEGDFKEDYMPCYQFMKTMYRRQQAGQANMVMGKKFELIKIVAQEGEQYVSREVLPAEPGNLRNPRLVQNIERKAVPVFKRLHERNPDAAYQYALEMAERERLTKEHAGMTIPHTREEMIAAAESATSPVVEQFEAKPVQTLKGKGR